MAARTMATTAAHKRTLMAQRSDARLAELIATRILPNYTSTTLLDIGCGDGVVSRHLPSQCEYTGLDISDACIYEQRHDNPKVRYVQAGQIPDLMRSEGPWDTVLLLDVIEHTRRFTPLFELALTRANQQVVVSLPNELFVLDRLRMLRGHELNAHSLDLVDQPEGFKHQFIVNIDKARSLLSQRAEALGFNLTEEILRPLISKRRLAQPACWALQQLSSPQLWSMGSVFIFQRRA
ncbi:bifunctional 2-polyprenyl-6-hydroxyphenol methylase/3-demethylubiquinol 3-O-methyltransferase UbiG [Synechococcus sp. CB0205]|uniref:class I SAM-dependent methyltransferase n=1 Tax=Synechococcus sp. CB0205 TaxID=232363 RepID=UPI00020024C3|nr:methyltransferase domain-containing protein [Synechococcus sp. CB0205]